MEKEQLLRLNLQHFAEGSEGNSEGESGSEGEGTEENSEGESATGDENETLEMTAEELQKKIESESDKKLNKVLDKKMKEWETEYNKKLENAKKEGERLAKLSAKERQEEEIKKQSQALEKREQELLTKELKAQTISDLHEKKLPPHFADFLMGTDAESTLENITAFKTDYDKAIEQAVEERLKGKSPNTGTGSSDRSTKGNNQEDFMEIMNKNRIVGS